MSDVNSHAARAHPSRLMDTAAAREEVVIARGGRPGAKLMPLASVAAPAKRTLGALAGKLRVPADFDAPLPDAVLDDFDGR